MGAKACATPRRHKTLTAVPLVPGVKMERRDIIKRPPATSTAGHFSGDS